MAIIEVKVPSPGESISHVELARWLIQEGDIVQINTEIAELESDKATLMLVANQGGKVSLKASEGDSLEVGAIACTIDTSHQPESPQTPEVSTVASEADAGRVDGGRVDGGSKDKPALLDKVKVTPLAKKVMEQNDLSIDEVISGLRRLRKEDVEASIQALRNKDRAANPIHGIKKPASRESRSERLSSLRRKLSQRLVSVKNDTAMLTTFNEVDMKAIMDLRKRHQKAFLEAHGIKLGFMSFFLKACSVALREFPNVNAALDGELLTTYDYVDISVAVSAPKGLMVPVVRNVESLGLAEIERVIADLAEKARESRLSIPEMSGGTFTVTNGGVFGSMMSTPLINPPQSAILGMHNILERPVAIDGQVVIRPMMYVALSYDHRVVDGKESVGFLVRVKQLLENPTEMLYQGSSAEGRLLDL